MDTITKKTDNIPVDTTHYLGRCLTLSFTSAAFKHIDMLSSCCYKTFLVKDNPVEGRILGTIAKQKDRECSICMKAMLCETLPFNNVLVAGLLNSLPGEHQSFYR